MSCREYRGNLIEFARGGLLDAAARRVLVVHVDRCAECARFLADQQALTAAEADLGAEPIPAADEIGIRVMAEFDRTRASRPAKLLAWRGVIGGLAAACLVIAAAIGIRGPVPAPQRPGGDEAPFLPIPYTVPLTPEEPATVLRMEIPVPALIAAGFQVRVSDPGAMVEADVLVSQDGRARAIRPLSISNSN